MHIASKMLEEGANCLLRLEQLQAVDQLISDSDDDKEASYVIRDAQM